MSSKIKVLPQTDGYTTLFDLFKASSRWMLKNYKEDPYPNYSFPEDFAGDDRKGQKCTLRISDLIARDLRNGKLTPLWRNGTESLKIPLWAWKRDDLTYPAINTDNGLSLNPCLPEKFQVWNKHQPSLPYQEAKAWLDRLQAMMSDWPIIQPDPNVFAKDMPFETSRPLPNTAYVSLTEAITWLAFDVSLSSDELFNGGSEPFDVDSMTFDTRTNEALEKLLNEALHGRVEITAKVPPLDKNKSLPRQTLTTNDLIDIKSWKVDRDQLLLTKSADVLEKAVFCDVMIKYDNLLSLSKTSNLIPTGLPGRPTKGRALIEKKHRSRIAAGSAEKTLADEARYLHNWFTETHPSHDPPTVTTIENTIRSEHRRYIGEITP